MTTVTLRPMTPAEFDEWQTALAEDYAAEQVASGRWPWEGAVRRARDESAQLLPQGPDTERMLVRLAVGADGEPVGRSWVALEPPHCLPGIAFLYDIEVLEPRRGQGLGRALLTATEDAARQAGATALELNVFGRNAAAVALYDSAGYAVVTQQMRKAL
ncbi:GNAT family N-acetyltransferase [Krasilnikoviella flava]|uniref:Ribosomal protein S18 acetylase RimI n=1 Tax=Krasilnikoviella flava TaxID=526729 RepID=A0A1T5IRU3_9MICO|nr:GNAT family N-acetyltransferase [Krasilnikoviella flava]SKC41879.1 Ribosomal protein S18 acetylase RimI [Krasilnikoviella flava]